MLLSDRFGRPITDLRISITDRCNYKCVYCRTGNEGAIYGDLIVEFGGRVHIYGHVSGNLLVFRGAKVINSGVISGNAANDGGRLYIDRDGQVLGRVKTENKGETTIEPKDDVPDEFA